MKTFFSKKIILTSMLLLSGFMVGHVQAKSKNTRVKVIPFLNPVSDFQFEQVSSIKQNSMYFFADIFFPEDLKNKHPQLNELEIENISTHEFSHKIVVARAIFKMDRPDGKIDFNVLNNKRTLSEIYNSETSLSKVDSNQFELSKSILVSSIDYQVKVESTYSGNIEADKYQQVLDRSRAMDIQFGEYLGSIVHEQKNFTRMFSTGFMVSNFYQVNENGQSKVIVSAYSMSYPRVSALKTLNRYLFWSSAKKKLVEEIKNSLKAVYKIARKIK